MAPNLVLLPLFETVTKSLVDKSVSIVCHADLQRILGPWAPKGGAYQHRNAPISNTMARGWAIDMGKGPVVR